MTHEVQRTESELLPLIGDDAIAAAEKRFENIRKIKILSLRATTPLDWVDLGGKPYLQDSGVMKIAVLFGVNFEDCGVEENRQKRGDRDVIQYIAKVRATFGTHSLEVEGICSSDDKFFGHKGSAAGSRLSLLLRNMRKTGKGSGIRKRPLAASGTTAAAG